MRKYCNIGMHQCIRVEHFMCTGLYINGLNVLKITLKGPQGLGSWIFFFSGLHLIGESLETSFKELEIKNLMMSFLFILTKVRYFTLFSHMFNAWYLHTIASQPDYCEVADSTENCWNLPGIPLPWPKISVQLSNCEVCSN